MGKKVRMRNTVRVLPLAVAALAGCATATQSSDRLAAADPISAQALSRRLHIFADDSMMGRQFGLEGNLKATAYLAAEARRLGLQPGGDNGTYYQEVPAFRIALAPEARILVDGAPLTLGSDFVPIYPASGRARTLTEATAIYGGDLSDTTKLISPEQASNKAVFFTASSPGQAAFARAGRYGNAAALVLVQNPRTANRYLITVSRDTAFIPNRVTVSPEVARRLLGGDMATLAPGATGKTLSFTGYAFTRAPVVARNVIAILPGSSPALRGQYVAIGSHNDHIGMRAAGPLDHDSLRAFNTIAQRTVEARTKATPGFPGSGLTPAERASIRVNVDSLRRIRPARPDSIYNGADDDGSGSMGMLAIAEAMMWSGTRPKRSILFVWHTGEEGGLRGARHFVDNPTVARDSIVAQLNLDMIGRGAATDMLGAGPQYLSLIGSRRLSTQLGDLVEAVNRRQAEPLAFDYALDADGHPERLYCRSDHYHYARYGIPVTFFTTGGHMDYHQLTDEPQYLDYEHLRKVVRLVHDVAVAAANQDARFVVDKPKGDPNAACVQ